MFDDPGDERERLLNAALQIWNDHGWAAVNVERAAWMAGVDPGAFRAEFPDDVALCCEVFDASSDERGSAALAAMDGAPDDRSRWRAAVEAYLSCMDDDPRHAAVLVEAIGCPELRARRRSGYRGFAALMAAQSTRSSGEPRVLSAAAHFCIGGLTEMTLAWLDPETDVDREAVLEQTSMLVEMVMAGY